MGSHDMFKKQDWGFIVGHKSHVLWSEQNTRGKRIKNMVYIIISKLSTYLNVKCDHTLCSLGQPTS